MQKMLTNLKREISILQKLDHVNIVKIIDCLYYPERVYIMLEMCSQGDLQQLLKKKEEKMGKNGGRFVEKIVQVYMSQIVSAFKDMFSKKVIHRDLKPANILLFNEHLLKITDFGFARQLSHMNEPSNLTRVGSPYYMSPQILSGALFSSKCDVWSLGIIIYQMLMGKTPWVAQTHQELLRNINDKPDIKFDKSIEVSQEL